VAIFVWLTFWGWLWGVPGMLLAVPLLAILKIVCDHIRPLKPVGEFLGD
jgi:predicted PurR-regulated permease PerM